MRANQIQASVPAPVASLPPREPMPSVHFSMARTVHFSMAIDMRSREDDKAGVKGVIHPGHPTPTPGWDGQNGMLLTPTLSAPTRISHTHKRAPASGGC